MLSVHPPLWNGSTISSSLCMKMPPAVAGNSPPFCLKDVSHFLIGPVRAVMCLPNENALSTTTKPPATSANAVCSRRECSRSSSDNGEVSEDIKPMLRFLMTSLISST